MKILMTGNEAIAQELTKRVFIMLPHIRALQVQKYWRI